MMFYLTVQEILVMRRARILGGYRNWNSRHVQPKLSFITADNTVVAHNFLFELFHLQSRSKKFQHEDLKFFFDTCVLLFRAAIPQSSVKFFISTD